MATVSFGNMMEASQRSSDIATANTIAAQLNMYNALAVGSSQMVTRPIYTSAFPCPIGQGANFGLTDNVGRALVGGTMAPGRERGRVAARVGPGVTGDITVSLRHVRANYPGENGFDVNTAEGARDTGLVIDDFSFTVDAQFFRSLVEVTPGNAGNLRLLFHPDGHFWYVCAW